MSATIPTPPSPRAAASTPSRTDTLAANSFDCTFPDGPASTIVSVSDDDGDPTSNIGADAITVTVANVIPVVTAPADQTANEGTSTSFSLGSFTDPGADVAVAGDRRLG